MEKKAGPLYNKNAPDPLAPYMQGGWGTGGVPGYKPRNLVEELSPGYRPTYSTNTDLTPIGGTDGRSSSSWSLLSTYGMGGSMTPGMSVSTDIKPISRGGSSSTGTAGGRKSPSSPEALLSSFMGGGMMPGMSINTELTPIKRASFLKCKGMLKKAGPLSGFDTWLGRNPGLGATTLGALAGGVLGGITAKSDPYTGETRRMKRALLGALIGGGGGFALAKLKGYPMTGRVDFFEPGRDIAGNLVESAGALQSPKVAIELVKERLRKDKDFFAGPGYY